MRYSDDSGFNFFGKVEDLVSYVQKNNKFGCSVFLSHRRAEYSRNDGRYSNNLGVIVTLRGGTIVVSGPM